MSGVPCLSISEVLLDSNRPPEPAAAELVWNLNLEQIESGSGKVLDRVRVPVSSLGPSTYPFSAGTVLYSKLRPYLNKVVIADMDGYATTELVPLRCNPEKVYAPYLAYYLRSPEFLRFANTVVAGAKMPRMVMSEFWRYQVPVPSIPEQRRIASILDQADALRAKRREALKLLDELQRGIFNEMFGGGKEYRQTSLHELCELITDGTHQTPTYADEGVVFLSAKNVTSGRIDWDNVKYIPQSLHIDLHKRLAPRLNDILLAKNGTTGISAIVDRDCIFDIYVSLALIRPKREFLSSFIHAAINSDACQRQFKGALKGIGVPNLHLKEIRGTRLPCPPMVAQVEFANRIAGLEAVRENALSSLAELDELFRSLQHRAFGGEL